VLRRREDPERDPVVDRCRSVHLIAIALGRCPRRHPSLPSFVTYSRSSFGLPSKAERQPEFDLGAPAGLACDTAPAAGKLRALSQSHKTDVARRPFGFRHDKTGSVVTDVDADSSVYQFRRHRPSGDVLFESIAAAAGRAGVAIVLSGMGADGAAGAAAVRGRGGLAIAQDKESSAVYGMPKAAIDRGVDAVLSPAEIANYLLGLSHEPFPVLR